jgi:hypothetical protein
VMIHGWSHPPEDAAWSATTDDRVLDGAVAQELPSRASRRPQHLVLNTADTDKRWSEGLAPRLPKEAASSWNRGPDFSQKKENRKTPTKDHDFHLTAGPP